jgi:hypothetical protein
MEVNERIAQLIKTVFGTQANAARALKVDRQRINAIVSGLKPGLEFYLQLSEAVDRLNFNWLLKEEGPMFVNWETDAYSENLTVNNQKDKVLERIINIWDAERRQWEGIRREQNDRFLELNSRMENLELLLSSLCNMNDDKTVSPKFIDKNKKQDKRDIAVKDQ